MPDRPGPSQRVTHLTRDGKAGGPVYRSPSLSTDGRRLAFLKGRGLYVARARPRRPQGRRAGRDRGGADAPGRPPGRLRAQLTTDHRPGLSIPYYSPPVYGQVPYLFLRARRSRRPRRRPLGRDGGLAARPGHGRPFRQGGSGPVPDDVCAVVPGAQGVCERTIASDGGPRTLSAPAASPDGRYLAAVAEPWSDAQDYHQTFGGSIALFDPDTGAHLRDLTTGPRRRPAGVLARRKADRVHARQGHLRGQGVGRAGAPPAQGRVGSGVGQALAAALVGGGACWASGARPAAARRVRAARAGRGRARATSTPPTPRAAASSSTRRRAQYVRTIGRPRPPTNSATRRRSTDPRARGGRGRARRERVRGRGGERSHTRLGVDADRALRDAASGTSESGPGQLDASAGRRRARASSTWPTAATPDREVHGRRRLRRPRSVRAGAWYHGPDQLVGPERRRRSRRTGRSTPATSTAPRPALRGRRQLPRQLRLDGQWRWAVLGAGGSSPRARAASTSPTGAPRACSASRRPAPSRAAWSGVGGGPGQFSHPSYAAVDCRGTLYVADVDNNRIQRLGEPGAAPCGDPGHGPAERLV